MKPLLFGLRAYFQGVKFWLGQKKLLRISIIPLFLYLFFMSAGLMFAVTKLPELTAWLTQTPQVWYQYLLYYTVLMLTGFVLFFIVILGSAALANILAFPFNDALAEYTLVLSGVEIQKPKTFKFWLQAHIKMFFGALKKTLILLILGVVLFAAALLPGLGVPAAIIGMFFLSLDLFDYTFDHYFLSYDERKSFIRQHFWQVLGFSLGLGLTASIPVINILCIPGGVVAGARLVAEMKRRKHFEGPHSQTTR